MIQATLAPKSSYVGVHDSTFQPFPAYKVDYESLICPKSLWGLADGIDLVGRSYAPWSNGHWAHSWNDPGLASPSAANRRDAAWH